MDLQLKGQVALVTGGTKGIGRAIAETFASEGCNVAICARKEDEVKAAVAALQKKGVKAFGKAVDVGKGDQLKAWINESAEALGGIDILVSNVSGGNAPGRSGLAFELRARHARRGALRRSVVAVSVEVEERQHRDDLHDRGAREVHFGGSRTTR